MLSIFHAGTYCSRQFYSGEVTPRRRLTQYELEYYRSGSGFSCIDDRYYPHTPGMVLFARPGQSRFSLGSFECEYIHFDCDEPLFLSACTDLTGVVPGEESLLPLFTALQTEPTPLAAYSLILQILTFLSAHSDARSATVYQNARYLPNIIAAKEYMDHRYSEKITLEHLAQVAYLSPNFMRTKFREIIGLSPRAYLQELRLNTVCRLLLETDLPIAVIAAQCGFESPSYLDNVFQKSKGMTPKEYRLTRRTT